MRRSVVAVDDDSATLDLIELVLQNQGYTLRRPLLRELSVRWIEREQPEFLILELAPFHPEETLVFLTKLRNSMATRALPVIMTSTDYRLLDQLERPLFHLGCATLKKPFELDTFLAVIDQAGTPYGFQRQVASKVRYFVLADHGLTSR